MAVGTEPIVTYFVYNSTIHTIETSYIYMPLVYGILIPPSNFAAFASLQRVIV